MYNWPSKSINKSLTPRKGKQPSFMYHYRRGGARKGINNTKEEKNTAINNGISRLWLKL